ncbi:unnamed protein product [Bursaphelenchus xylophilus]|uniref:(pine wood nematode) hypothetical protein n=1 Tax=Bursaphelenchus xylophilus TaxID=6326 RepID=A0A1I7RVN9_BURXY|nr:unnamed protein product [Bursaphelenchus xylophilus]CAG9081945.1 unnamed protein product [Bursaphelenchus xylophilus]
MPPKGLKTLSKKKKKTKEPVEIFDVGRPRPQRALDCARIMVDFLEAMFHKLALQYCDLKGKVADSFCGILYYRCAREAIRTYMTDMRSTLRYWISHQHLTRFSVVLKDVQSGEELGIITFGLFSGTDRNWASKAIRKGVIHELKDQLMILFEKLDELPTREQFLKDFGEREVGAKIRLSLLPEVPKPDLVSAIKWKHDPDALCAPKKKLLYSTPRINSEFVEFSLQCSSSIIGKD